MSALNDMGKLGRQVVRSLRRTSRRRANVEAALSRLSEITSRRDHAGAVELALALDPLCGDDPRFLKRARLAYSRAGELTRAHDAARRLHAVANTPENAQFEAELAGRLQETTPGWLPRVQGEATLARDPNRGRVVHLLKASAPYRESGYTLRSRYTLAAQVAAGLQPVAITALGFPRTIGVDSFPDIEEVDGIEHIHLDVGNTAGMPADAYLEAYANAAATHVREISPELIHVHSGHRGYDNALVGLALGRHFGVPVVYEIRGFFEAGWTAATVWVEHSEYYRRRMATEQYCMEHADAIVTLSESMKSDIIDRGIDPSKIVVAPNGVDSAHFTPQHRRADLVDRYELANAFVFGYISNLDHPRENQEVLVEAALRLRTGGVPAIALIVGDGRRRADLEDHVASVGASGAVIFTGRVDHAEVLDYYALLDVFVVPRLPDRASRLVTPLKPYEAMAAGVPVVVSDLDALREIIADGKRGRSFAAGDPAALADVLKGLHDDPAARSSLATSARDWVVNERGWQANGHRYVDLYRRVLATDSRWGSVPGR